MNDHEQQESLFELASVLQQQTDYNEILRVISSKTAALFSSEVASIVMINPRTQDTLKTVIKETKGIEKEQYQLAQTNIVGWVMRNKISFLSADLPNDKRFNEDLFKNLTVHSAMCVPLQYRGSDIGYIVVINNDDSLEYKESSLKLLERISDISSPHISSVQNIQEYFSVPLTDESIIYKYRQFGLLGKSETFVELLQSIEAAARCDVRVVLEGQTGTGKELIARAVHNLSSRSEYPFVAIDCGAIPQNLMESELFGHLKGSFTGANRDRPGLITEANNGTLFMDEVNNLSLEMQAKLLRVLQEGEVRPVGSNKKTKVNVRIISASSMSLSSLVDTQEFREDLYFRLMVYPIYVPTLDERNRDIPLLANHFVQEFAKEQNKKIQFFHKDILEYLKSKHWGGNIRELKNFVERLVTLAPGSAETLNISDLPQNFKKEIESFAASQKIDKETSLKESVHNFERDLILRALEENDWNQIKTAKSLDILEQTLRAKMNKLGIVRPK
jgi:transcriptional regulator with GAF, ATPase, and Fis domain